MRHTRNHGRVGSMLYRISNKIKRVAQQTRGVHLAGWVLDVKASEDANGRILAELQAVQVWVNWAVEQLTWLKGLDAGTSDLEKPPEEPENYLY